MKAYVLRRLIQTAFTVVIITFISFLFLHLMPGDPVLIMIGTTATQEEVDALRHEFWLDRPIIVQYLRWASNLLQGELGRSFIYGDDIAESIAKRAPVTAMLGGAALFLGFWIAVPAGVLCAVRRGSRLDTIITVITNIGIAVPLFWLGILLIYLFGLKLRWLPFGYFISPFDDLWLGLKSLILPAICLSVWPIAFITRQMRSSMLEVIHQDYIRTAWSKGLKERIIIVRHALKNAFIPVITLIGLKVATVIGGSVLVETVFNIPGMAQYIYTGVMDNDYIVVQSTLAIIALFVCLVNLLVDISYGWFDPRIRHS